jgi:dTDP-4-dehydrorhamnose 3,5-epimerase
MGNQKLIDGIIVNKEKIISHEKGDIHHIIKKNNNGFYGFGEVYFSKIKFQDIKAWKKHYDMICNFVVIHGEIKIVVYDNRENSETKLVFNEFILSKENYYRITIPNGLWYGFKGVSEDENILLNFSNILHNADEQINKEINFLNYKW